MPSLRRLFGLFTSVFTLESNPMSRDQSTVNAPRSVNRPLRKHLDRHSMSPSSRTSDWVATTPGRVTTSILGPNTHGARIAKRTSSVTRSSRSGRDGRDVPNREEEDESDEPVIDAQSQNEVLADRSFAQARRAAETRHLTTGQHWSVTEQELFEHLRVRGFEPLIPFNWTRDFRTFPARLFATADETPIINSLHGSEFRATKALHSLIRMGVRARDRIVVYLRPEPVLYKTIKNYFKTVMEDANLTRYPSNGISVVKMVSLKENQTKEETLQRMSNKLRGIADQWRKWNLRHNIELPVLTGILIIHSLVCIVTFDPNGPADGNPANGQNEPRKMMVMDLCESGYDVWNAVAIGIVGMHLRSVRVALEETLMALEE